jgi:hypothetical protein
VGIVAARRHGYARIHLLPARSQKFVMRANAATPAQPRAGSIAGTTASAPRESVTLLVERRTSPYVDGLLLPSYEEPVGRGAFAVGGRSRRAVGGRADVLSEAVEGCGSRR